jgi:hypothetical protein
MRGERLTNALESSLLFHRWRLLTLLIIVFLLGFEELIKEALHAYDDFDVWLVNRVVSQKL